MTVLVRKSSLRTWLAAGAALPAAVLAPPATAEEPAVGNRGPTIVFVCLHGSVKSQVAAAHFNRIAKERGLPYSAVSRGIDVDASIPTRIRDGLSLDGLASTNDVPRGLTPEEAEGATKVVAFDQVPDERRGISEVTYWTDVPLPTRDYEGARDMSSLGTSTACCPPCRGRRSRRL